LHALNAAVEAYVEEGVIYKVELFDSLKVFWIEAGAEHATMQGAFRS
jgi:hypothetical protein